MRKFLLAYGTTIAAVALAMLCRELLDPILGDQLPYPTFFLAVIFSSMVGGLWPAILATLMGAILTFYFYIPPRHSFAIPDTPYQIGLALYLLVGFAIAAFGEATRIAQQRFEELAYQKDDAAQAKAASIEFIREKVNFQDTAFVGFGLTLIVLIVGGVMGVINTRRLTENERQVARTHEVRAELEILLSTLKDAETGQRGYLLVQDEKYLQPYEEAVERLQTILTRLAFLTSENSLQQERLRALQPKIARRLAEIKQTIDLAKYSDRPAAMQIIRTDAGKKEMDSVRSGIALMLLVEEAILSERALQSKVSATSAIMSILLTVLIGILLVVVVFVIGQRNLFKRQRAARNLAEQAERLRTTLASIGDAVITTDLHGRITNMNAVAESLTGWANADAIGQTLDAVFKIVNEETRGGVENPATRALKDGVIVGLANHTVLIARDGSELPIDDSAAPIRCKEGEIVGCVLVFRDVTERQQLEKLNNERLIGARKLASIVDSSNDAIISQSTDGVIQSWNAAADRMFGFSASEAVGRHISVLIPPERAGEEDRIMNRLRVGDAIEHFDTVRVRKDGKRIQVSLTISPVRDADGRMVGASKIVRDISERKKLEDDLRQLAVELSEAHARKDEFLATLAHELRNPLAPIRNGLQVLRLGGDGQAAGVEQTRIMMERQLGQLVRLVDDLMDVSRITRGNMELRKERVSLASVIHSAIETSTPIMDERGHHLTLTLPAEPIVVDADITRLAQVFANLLNNAAKYMDRGGEIFLSAEQEGDEVVVTVKDQGIGIASDQINRIFQMFTQVDGSLEKAQGGLGIGLTLVRRLTEMHGGTIVAQSEGIGKGSQFVVRLPIVAEASPARAASSPESPAPKSDLRILIVDDNRDGADSLAMMLEVMGNETRIAYDGQEGVDVARVWRPDLILLDIGLPKLNGYEACRRIRAQPGGEGAVIIAVTGWGQEEDRRRSKEAGFDHHLVKPVDPVTLTKLLLDLNLAVNQ